MKYVSLFITVRIQLKVILSFYILLVFTILYILNNSVSTIYHIRKGGV
mgnify:CR=1 FL=1